MRARRASRCAGSSSSPGIRHQGGGLDVVDQSADHVEIHTFQTTERYPHPQVGYQCHKLIAGEQPGCAQDAQRPPDAVLKPAVFFQLLARRAFLADDLCRDALEILDGSLLGDAETDLIR